MREGRPTPRTSDPTAGQLRPEPGVDDPTRGQRPPEPGVDDPTRGQRPPTRGQRPPTAGQRRPPAGQEDPTRRTSLRGPARERDPAPGKPPQGTESVRLRTNMEILAVPEGVRGGLSTTRSAPMSPARVASMRRRERERDTRDPLRAPGPMHRDAVPQPRQDGPEAHPARARQRIMLLAAVADRSCDDVCNLRLERLGRAPPFIADLSPRSLFLLCEAGCVDGRCKGPMGPVNVAARRRGALFLGRRGALSFPNLDLTVQLRTH